MQLWRTPSCLFLWVLPHVRLKRKPSADVYLNNGCDEFFKEWQTHQARPVAVDEIDQEALDVWPVLILISHDHQAAVSQGLQLLHWWVFFVVLQTQDLDQAVDFCILKNLENNNKNKQWRQAWKGTSKITKFKCAMPSLRTTVHDRYNG